MLLIRCGRSRSLLSGLLARRLLGLSGLLLGRWLLAWLLFRRRRGRRLFARLLTRLLGLARLLFHAGLLLPRLLLRSGGGRLLPGLLLRRSRRRSLLARLLLRSRLLGLPGLLFRRGSRRRLLPRLLLWSRCGRSLPRLGLTRLLFHARLLLTRLLFRCRRRGRLLSRLLSRLLFHARLLGLSRLLFGGRGGRRLSLRLLSGLLFCTRLLRLPRLLLHTGLLALTRLLLLLLGCRGGWRLALRLLFRGLSGGLGAGALAFHRRYGRVHRDLILHLAHALNRLYRVIRVLFQILAGDRAIQCDLSLLIDTGGDSVLAELRIVQQRLVDAGVEVALGAGLTLLTGGLTAGLRAGLGAGLSLVA